MFSQGSIQEVNYEGETYLLFDSLVPFVKEVVRSKKAVLKTKFEDVPNQRKPWDLFQGLSKSLFCSNPQIIRQHTS